MKLRKRPQNKRLSAFGAHDRLREGYYDPQKSGNRKNSFLIELE